MNTVQPGAGRDPERAPMPWNNEPYYAGFSSVEPWLPLPSDFGRFSVATQQADSTSILHLYRQLIALHHTSSALLHGDFHVLTGIPEHVLAYRRSFSGQSMLVALNFDDVPHTLPLPDDGSTGEIRLSTHLKQEEVTDHFVVLRSYEGILLEQVNSLIHTSTQVPLSDADCFVKKEQSGPSHDKGACFSHDIPGETSICP